MITSRRVDLARDRAFVLEMHLIGAYEGDPAWFRDEDLASYRARWLATPQRDEFLAALERSLADARTIADVWEEDGEPIGFLWTVFHEITGYGITYADVADIEVVPSRRREGIGRRMLEHAERHAREAGAATLRADVGWTNAASRALHGSLGFTELRVVYEKRIGTESSADV